MRERMEDDFYATEAWPVIQLLDAFESHPACFGVGPDGEFVGDWLKRRPVLDPCAGDGALLNVVQAFGPPEVEVHAWELRSDEYPGLWRRWRDRVCIGDALISDPGDKLIITNPPYKLAIEFVRHFRRQPLAAFLLRSAFLSSQGRRPFLLEHRPAIQMPLARRPKFTWPCSTKGCKRQYRRGWLAPCEDCGGAVKPGTDKYDYSWFVWLEGWDRPWTRTILLPDPPESIRLDDDDVLERAQLRLAA